MIHLERFSSINLFLTRGNEAALSAYLAVGKLESQCNVEKKKTGLSEPPLRLASNLQLNILVDV